MFCIPLLALGSLLAADPRPSDVEALIRSLNADEAKVRFEAARSLRDLGPKARPAIGELVTALADSGAPETPDIQYLGPRVRDMASDALVRIGAPAVPALTKAVSSKDETVRAAAAATLGKLGPAAMSSVSALEGGMNDPQEPVRLAAVRALARLGIDPNRVVPLLAKASRTERGSLIASAAAAGLYDADPEGRLAIPILVELLKSSEGRIVAMAAQTLGKFGVKARAATTALIGALSSKDYHFGSHFDFAMNVPVRSDVARAIGEVGPAAVAAVAPLTRMMHEDAELSARLWAASSIIRVADRSVAAQAAFKLLLQTARDNKSRERVTAIEALGVLGTREAVTALIAILLTHDESKLAGIRIAAARALGRGVGKRCRPCQRFARR